MYRIYNRISWRLFHVSAQLPSVPSRICRLINEHTAAERLPSDRVIAKHKPNQRNLSVTDSFFLNDRFSVNWVFYTVLGLEYVFNDFTDHR